MTLASHVPAQNHFHERKTKTIYENRELSRCIA